MTRRSISPFEYEPGSRGKRNCTCETQRTPLAPALRGYQTRLGCYCESDPILGRCQCSEQPWGDGPLSDFVGVNSIAHPQELNDPSNRELYKLGCHVHCFVRRLANNTIANLGFDIGLGEFEAEVFRRPFREPLDLRVKTIRDVKALFSRKVSYAGLTLQGPHIVDARGIRALEAESDAELEKLMPAQVQPVVVSTGPGDFLHSVKCVQGYEWIDVWRTVHMLELTGLSEGRKQSYGMIFDAQWPDVPRERTKLADLERLQILKVKMETAEKRLSETGLTETETKKLKRALRDAQSEASILEEIQFFRNQFESYCRRLVNRELTPEQLHKLDVVTKKIDTCIHECRKLLLRASIKTDVSRGNRYLKLNIKDLSSFDQADELALACQRDGVAMNLEHFFASEDDRAAFIREYASDDALENARKRAWTAIGSHSRRLESEIFDEDDAGEDVSDGA